MSRLARPPTSQLDIEAEFDDVAVGHGVVLALYAHLSTRTCFGHRAGIHDVLVGNDLGLDEAAFEVGMNHPGGLWRGGTPLDRPGPRLLRTGSEERLESERFETDPGQLVNAGFFLAHRLQQLERFFVRQL